MSARSAPRGTTSSFSDSSSFRRTQIELLSIHAIRRRNKPTKQVGPGSISTPRRSALRPCACRAMSRSAWSSVMADQGAVIKTPLRGQIAPFGVPKSQVLDQVRPAREKPNE
jgi:hypothetical protein